MNIFALDKDPKLAARYHVDRHVIKMILESAQILCTVNTMYGLPVPYRSTHVNHPCVKWAAKSAQNWLWLYRLAHYLNLEYKYRYGKCVNHKSWDVIESLDVPRIPQVEMTPFYQAMPEEYKTSDPIKAYRAYYKYGKVHLHMWTKRKEPYWLKEVL